MRTVWTVSFAFFAPMALSCAGGHGSSSPTTVPATPGSSPTPTSLPGPSTTTATGHGAGKASARDTYHGTVVDDPFRWLEDGESPDVKTWTADQNRKTRDHLDALAGRPELKTRIQSLLEVGSVGVPVVRKTRRGEFRYFHSKREGTQNQPVYYVRDGLGGKDRALIDVASMAQDGTVSLDWAEPSQDGQFVAWGRSESGSEESTLYVRQVDSGKDLEDAIPHTRHGSVAWMPDGKGFFYSRYPVPGTVPAGDEKYFRKIYFHTIGTDWKGDKLVFGEGRDKTDSPSVLVSPDGHYLVIRVHEGWQKSEVYLKDLKKGLDSPWVEVATGSDALFDPIVRNDKLFLVTNEGTPRYRLVSVDYAKPSKAHWNVILAEGADVLQHVDIVGSTLVATYLHDASSRIERYDLRGKALGAIELPALGTAYVSGPDEGTEAFLSFTSFVVPTQVLRADLKTGKTALWDRVGASFVAPSVTVRREYATSKDGTKVPMFVVEKEGARRDGTAPALLWGYGGFNQNTTPAFSARALAMVERGGVWVSAVLRGGGEFGEDWHRGGMLANKQNVFDDFVACAEWLVLEKVAAADRLAVGGGSNGGLLTSAVITQRPELFRAALSLVPLTDMLRYHHFRIAKLWIPEYGSADDADQFKVLYAYSPYHRVRDGVKYPAVLYTTAESDTRVDPMHARKMAARLQLAQSSSDRPMLVRIEEKAGHGAGKPVTKLTEEVTDEMIFLFGQLGMNNSRK